MNKQLNSFMCGNIYQEPQMVSDWKKEKLGFLKQKSFLQHKKRYVKYETAKVLALEFFQKGFKVARRDRLSLAEHLLDEMEKRFTINKK